MMMVLGTFAATIIQGDLSVTDVLILIPHFVNQLVTFYFGLVVVFHIILILLISTRFISGEIAKTRNVLQLFNQNANEVLDIKSLVGEIYSLRMLIRKHNQLNQYLLKSSLFFLGPIMSLGTFTTTSKDDVPVWFTALWLATIYQTLILLQFTLMLSGSILNKTRSLSGPLYSVQATLIRGSDDSYENLLEVSRMIKLVSSNRMPMSFTEPDGTAFTSMTSVSFMASTMTNTLMFISNNMTQ